ncbi:MAG: hypothetical protein AAFQ74_10145 [Cyanobacteria bacterium J06623_4]
MKAMDLGGDLHGVQGDRTHPILSHDLSQQVGFCISDESSDHMSKILHKQ